MVISSLVIETMPDNTAQIAQEIVKTPGVEVHETIGYKLVVTIEAESIDASQEIANGFVTIPGVIGVNLVYANFEEDPVIQRALETRGIKA